MRRRIKKCTALSILCYCNMWHLQSYLRPKYFVNFIIINGDEFILHLISSGLVLQTVFIWGTFTKPNCYYKGTFFLSIPLWLNLSHILLHELVSPKISSLSFCPVLVTAFIT
uniref:Uncharacterized protein n=1 Tax=Opuntia streptacantha TaxID=393608 RepID=A0A7C9D065_OPUST